MAAYGYAAEFSSDDDERIEQFQDQSGQTKFDHPNRPNKKDIEDAIESIKRLPYDAEIGLHDDILAGLLDYYKTQRGPIVDSTRKLYLKIALRLVRGDQGQELTPVEINTKETNGNSNNNSTNNNNNNNSIGKSASQQSAADTFSSDDDDMESTNEFMSKGTKKFDSRVVYNNNNVVADDVSMEVDSDTPTGPFRESKQVEFSTSDENDDSSSGTDDEDDDEDDEESDDDDDSKSKEDSDSDALDVTPIKPPPSGNREKEAIEVLMAMRPSSPKQSESTIIKRQPLAQSTPKESSVGTAKKPLTRSQRVVTRSATKIGREASKVDGKNNSSSGANVFLERKRTSRRRYTLLAVAVLVLASAFLSYYFRSSIMNITEPLLRKKITF